MKLSKKVIFWISLIAIPGWIGICRANAVEDNFLSAPAAKQKNSSAAKPIEIHSGFFIFEGQYVPPPYVVQSRHGSVYINGLKVPQKRPGTFFRRSVYSYQSNRGPQKRGAAQVEEHLRLNGLLLCKQSGPTIFVSPDQAVFVLEILLSDEPSETKLQLLLNTNARGIPSNRWASLIKTFDGTTGLSDRLQAIKQHQAELVEDDTDYYELHWFLNSALTFSGFILAVWALGTLINCRPPMLSSPRAKVLSKDSCRRVIWLVVLIAVLNLYDLLCTLIAGSVGSLWELNPFASPIIHQNSEIVIFKLGMTVGAVILLLVARRHRLAQISSWWAGVLYTILILRWSTFNTMFL
jgi:hypothetical protein